MKSIWMLLPILLFTGCQSKHLFNTDQLYAHSITEAMSPDSSKISTNLIPIIPTNGSLVRKTIDGEEYILTVSWKNNVSYYKPYLDSGFYDTQSYEIWITTTPELLNFMSTQKVKDTSMRLKQLLGLPPNSEYKYFVEFWVKPADLFRPCPDNEITDQECDLCFPSSTDSTYIDWINGNRISRYYECELDNKYPWTQLGYTYDWNAKNKDHRGLSEFVIGENKKIKVQGIYTTQEYLESGGYNGK